MAAQKSRLSTVVIIDPESGKTKSVNIKTGHIQRLKSYVIYLAAVFAILLGSSIFMAYSLAKKEARMKVLSARISKLEGNIPSKSDTTSVKLYVQSIESKLKKLNIYLLNKGVQGFSNKSVGGDSKEADSLSVKEHYSFYERHVSQVFSAILNIPLGYPASHLVTSGFGYRSDPLDFADAEFHPGIDFKGNRGDEVKCTANGEVSYAGWVQGYGNCIRVKHSGGYETVYGHLSKIKVRDGEKVLAGQWIGNIGSTGRSTGNHLHYEVRKYNKIVNPSSFLKL